ncbi:MAG: YfhO family protein [Actinobacteria bacterium]|nr:YfhO family protein [Actinomycetota bacterium]
MERARRLDRRIPGLAIARLAEAPQILQRGLAKAATSGVWWRRALVALGLLAPLLVLYRQLLFAGEPWLDLDLLVSYQPRYRLLAAGLAEGRIPLWTDGMLGGFPVAFSEFGWFYPLTWGLLRLFEPLRAYVLELALGLLLAAVAAYWLGRVWGLSRLAAYLAAFLFAYGPFVFATSRFLNYADIFFALPAGLACIELVARGQARYAALLAAITGVMGLAGHPQIALLCIYGWVVCGAFRLWWTYRERGTRAVLATLAWLAPAMAIGVALAAVRLLPTVETTRLSARAGGLAFATAAQGSIPPWSVALGYLFPSFEIPRLLDDALNAEELLYLGVLTPPLAVLALVAGWRHRLVRCLAVLVGLSWILAMGSYSLGFPLIYKLPLFGFFRQPARFGIVASLGLGLLVGIALDLLRREGLAHGLLARALAKVGVWFAGTIAAGTAAATIVLTGFAFLIVPYGYDYIDRVIVGSEGRFLSAERYRLTFDQLYQRLETAFSLSGWTPRFVLLAAALGALALRGYQRGWLAPRTAPAVMAAILLGDVMLAPGHAVATVPAAWYQREPVALAAMDGEGPGGWRVFSYRGLAQKFELSTATGTRLTRDQRDLLEYVFLNETLTPNLPLTIGLPSIDGYENLMPRASAALLSAAGSERATTPGFAADPALDEPARQRLLAERLPLLTRAGVRYVTSGVPLSVPGLVERYAGRLATPDWAGVEQALYVYEAATWQPRAWVTHGWRVDPPDPARLGAAGEVSLDQDPGIAPGTSTTAGDAVVALAYGPETVALTVRLAHPGVVVVNEAMSPGWSARVNGAPAPVLTVNGLMRGVAAPAGTHAIELRYAPPGLRTGVAVSLVATGALAALLALALVAERRR